MKKNTHTKNRIVKNRSSPHIGNSCYSTILECNRWRGERGGGEGGTECVDGGKIIAISAKFQHGTDTHREQETVGDRTNRIFICWHRPIYYSLFPSQDLLLKVTTPTGPNFFTSRKQTLTLLFTSSLLLLSEGVRVKRRGKSKGPPPPVRP